MPSPPYTRCFRTSGLRLVLRGHINKPYRIIIRELATKRRLFTSTLYQNIAPSDNRHNSQIVLRLHMSLLNLLGVEYSYERKVAVELVKVQTVAIDEFVGDVEPNKVDRDINFTAVLLIEQATDT